jgi:hypothetical protein
MFRMWFLARRKARAMSRTGVGGSPLGGQMSRPLDMDELDSEASEFSWGPGLTPKGLENAPPSEGGRYRGQTPSCPNQVGVFRR